MMSTPFRFRIFLILISGLPSIISGCKDRPTASDTITTVRTPVTIIPVAFKPVTATLELPATSEFMNKNIVRATTAGTIQNIFGRQGDFVTAGQHLFTIKTREAAALGNISGNDSTLTFKGLININLK